MGARSSHQICTCFMSDPNELGSGAFGQVITGMYDKKQVAIKMLNKDGNDIAKNFRSLLAELKVMSYLGKHPHLVRMIGAITENISDGEVYLIFEYFSNGNVRKFMRSHRDTFVDLLADQVFSKPVRSRKSTRYVRYTGHSKLELPENNWIFERFRLKIRRVL